MKRNILLLISAVLFFGVFAQKTPQKFVFAKNTDFSFYPDRLSRIDSVFSKLTANGSLPQVVTFVVKNGIVVHNKAYGWRDIEHKIQIQKDDIFRMASQTKAITSVAVLILMEEGKLLLDDPVKKYIPEFAQPQVLVTFNESDTTFTTRSAKRDITIRDLLTHTAGISYGNNKTRKIYDKAGIPTSPMLSLETISLGEAIKRLAKCPLEHDPGEKFTYGMNTDVLGYLIEVVSGMPINQFFSKRIFEPLGMNNTWFYVPGNKKEKVVTLYSKYSPESPLQKNNKENGLYQTYPYSGAQKLLSTGAGLNGSIEDYARFCQMILNYGEFNGVRILSRKTVEMMNKNETGNLRGDYGYGLAYEVIRSDSGKGMPSDGSVSWGGWFNTNYVIDPKENMISIIYINAEPLSIGIDTKALFLNLVYQALK